MALSARAALVSAIYGKALRVGGAGLARLALGEVVNLMSADTDRVVNFFNSFHELWSLPFQLAIALYLLYLQVGVAFLGGLGVALLLVPFNKFLASRIVHNNRRMLRYKDARVKVSSRPVRRSPEKRPPRADGSGFGHRQAFVALPADDGAPAGHPRHQALRLGGPLCPQGAAMSRRRAVAPQGRQVPGRHVRVHVGGAARAHLHPHLPHLRAPGTPADRRQGKRGNATAASRLDAFVPLSGAVDRGRFPCRSSPRWLWWAC